MNENIYNTLNEDTNIQTIFELKEYINKLMIILKKREEIKNNKDIDYITKKITLNSLQNEENEIKSYILHGISIKDIDFKEVIIKIIINFLKTYNFTEEEIRANLSEIKLFTSDINLVYGGNLVTVGNNIGIDYEYVDFDKDGYYKSFKDNEIKFLQYTLTHEFFHKYSAFKKDSRFCVNDDALSEGFTDMLALMATNAYEYKSQKYDFLVKICTLLTNIIGMNEILDDYINHIDSWPNLKNFFNKINLNETDFNKFHTRLNKILELTNQQANNKELIDIINIKKQEIIIFIKEKILIPYLEKNTNKTEELSELFNSIFSEYNINLYVRKSTFEK